MLCKICNVESPPIFSKKILQKYDVSFFRCPDCGFMQTETAYWLSEAYALPFSPLDVYLPSRTHGLCEIVEDLILRYFDGTKVFLDYGGGIGLFTRMMRDKGFQFYRQDKYAQNLLSQFFDIENLPSNKQHFELVTCFEVLEHLEQPWDELDQIFSLANNILVSTFLQPAVEQEKLQSWKYIGELHGQHIAFYTSRCMEIIAERYQRNYYSNGSDLHLFTRRALKNFSFYSMAYKVREKLYKLSDRYYQLIRRDRSCVPQSLMQDDATWVAQHLRQSNGALSGTETTQLAPKR